ncbi:glycogen synthase [Paenibacillus sp. J31TS4]|uniref:glycogen synthase GlgA n=1 Tax=Paenibacillus sp. J31TS4 TaxID=2807195 RepID=UPI001B0F177F|nr:glycogen synthase GlgA [Paenibacillus sp. J31TS4]GIP37387.1 glycogen synthase [Paenibacillus sp. J31TS4]
MKILFAASEAVPFVKTGGLADVIGSLPQALKELGHDVRVILPKYEDIPESYRDGMTLLDSFTVPVGWRNQYCGVEQLELEGVVYYFIDNEFYFRRKGIYGYGDDAERFVFFSRAVADAIPRLGFLPDIVHCNDWQTGLVPFCLKVHHGHQEEYARIRTVFTIHNLKYQGRFNRGLLQDLLGVGDEYFTADKLEFYGDGSCMKGGLVYSDAVTTVSPTYAEEIRTRAFGEGLDGMLRARGDDLLGILNGIDAADYDPMKDPNLAVPYRNSMAKKRLNKSRLQEEVGLPVREDVPLIGIVSRLVEQKGFDLIACVLDDILRLDVQLVVLGTGDRTYEELFRDAAGRYPDKLSANIRFHEPLSRRIYAGSDLFLMPSLFEPCGLGQLIALRYKAAPIVRETGGLKDTVQAFDELTGQGNGFSFANYNAHDMLYTIERAVKLYQDPKLWATLADNMGRKDFSWRRSAQQYASMYGKLLAERCLV